MIAFAPAKINLGLRVIGKRPDGFHQIETVMMEVPFFDIIEIVKFDEFQFVQSGIAIGEIRRITYVQEHMSFFKMNMEYLMFEFILESKFQLEQVGSGGSSDAVTVIKMLIDLFQLKLSVNEIEEISAELGK